MVVLFVRLQCRFPNECVAHNTMCRVQKRKRECETTREVTKIKTKATEIHICTVHHPPPLICLLARMGTIITIVTDRIATKESGKLRDEAPRNLDKRRGSPVLGVAVRLFLVCGAARAGHVGTGGAPRRRRGWGGDLDPGIRV